MMKLRRKKQNPLCERIRITPKVRAQLHDLKGIYKMRGSYKENDIIRALTMIFVNTGEDNGDCTLT